MNISHFCFVNTKIGIETVASFFNIGKHLIVVLQLLKFLFGNSCKTNCSSKKMWSMVLCWCIDTDGAKC